MSRYLETKIEKLIEELKEERKYLKEQNQKILDLYIVNKKRELLIKWEKSKFSEDSWEVVGKLRIGYINDWIAN